MAQTRATVAKHPVHPMLVVFPIGLWVAALAFDIIYADSKDDPRLQARK